jgi:RNA polymerase-associated protein RTF1
MFWKATSLVSASQQISMSSYITEPRGRNTTFPSYRISGSLRYDPLPHFPGDISLTNCQADLDAYKQSLAETNAKLPTQTMLKEKYDAIRDLMNHSWTDAEVTQRLAKSHQYAHLLKQRSADQPRIATQAELEAQRIAELNSRNRRLDSERVRKALIEEQRQKKLERRREIERKKKEEEEAARKKAEEEKAAEDDLFGGDSKTEDQRDTPKPAEKEQAKGLPTFRKPKLDDDIIASLDIGVEIEI